MYLNRNKTVKAHSRINNTDGGFGLALETDERFSRSISYVGALKDDGSTTINLGDGADGAGKIYSLYLMACDFELQPGNSFWADGNILFTNWDHDTQIVSEPMSFEACTQQAFFSDALHMTYNTADQRCIISDAASTLAVSSEGSIAYERQCD